MKRLGIFFVGIFLFSGCINIFDPVDTPSGDEQVLAAARACFDDGDLDCAADFYKQLSNSFVDRKNTEEAFLILERAGIGMSFFIQAFGDGGGGRGLGKLANLLSGNAAVVSRRTTIFEAFKKHDAIQDRNLRNFLKFVTALTFAAHILAEEHRADTTDGFTGADFVLTPAACKTIDVASCAGEATCGRPVASTLDDTAAPATSDTEMTSSDTISGQRTLLMLHKALLAVDQAIRQIGVGGKFSTSLGSFTGQIALLSGISNSNCYRWLLASNGVVD